MSTLNICFCWEIRKYCFWYAILTKGLCGSRFCYLSSCKKEFKKVRKTARIRNWYNQVPHLSQDNKWESNKITINITNKSQINHYFKPWMSHADYCIIWCYNLLLHIVWISYWIDEAMVPLWNIAERYFLKSVLPYIHQFIIIDICFSKWDHFVKLSEPRHKVLKMRCWICQHLPSYVVNYFTL